MNNRYLQVVDGLMRRSVDYYKNNGLAYHNGQHIYSMLTEAQKLFGRKFTKVHADLVCLAISYHDAVYVPGANRHGLPSNVNEEMSALAFKNDYFSLTLPEERYLIPYEAVMDLIRVTWWENHVSETFVPKTFVEGVILDVDIHTLASDWDDFVRIQKSIIRENIGMVEPITEEHLRMSAEFLRKFLRRTFIYHTGNGRDLWEAKARANILKFVDMHQ